MGSDDCLFCRIFQRTLPAEIVAEEDGVLAFKDIHPQAPIHLLIIPIVPIPTVEHMTPSQTLLIGQMVQLGNRMAREYGLVKSGYRLVINCGVGAGQSVWHVHAHLLGGRPLQWPPG